MEEGRQKKNSRTCSEASVLNGQAMILNGLTLKVTYEDHLGAWLLDKRIRHGKAEYAVEWKGRPEMKKSWRNERAISRVRISESAYWAKVFLQW
jgi:hypothetical protein